MGPIATDFAFGISQCGFSAKMALIISSWLRAEKHVSQVPQKKKAVSGSNTPWLKSTYV